MKRLKAAFPLVDESGACYVVGGALRDLLIGREPADVDLACPDPRAVADAFARKVGGRFVDLGRERFVTLRVAVRGAIYDFTALEGDLLQDLGRRDFTLNALAIDLADHSLFDPFDGISDLRAGIVRMVSEQNLVDDPLRIVKGVRMAVTLDFAIEPATLAAMRTHAWKVQSVAPERTRAEIDLIMTSPAAAEGVRLMHATGLDRISLGGEVDAETIAMLHEAAADDPVVRWAAIFRRAKDRAVRDYALTMRWSEREIRELSTLRHIVSHVLKELPEHRALELHRAGRETVQHAVRLLTITGHRDRAKELQAFVELRGAALFDTAPLLSGHDLKEVFGLAAGKLVGEAKELAFRAQLRGDVHTRDEAIGLLRRWMAQRPIE